MVKENGLAVNAGRLDIVDALRGFALVGVGLVHMLEQYYANPHQEAVMAVAAAGAVNQIIGGLNFTLLMGKFYLMFSLLFGLSFYIQIDRPSREGQPYQARFIWRLVLLFCFGLIHHFFYRGDILMIYAMLGLLLLPLHRISTKYLLAIAGILFLGAGRFISFAIFDGVGPFGGPDFDPKSENMLAYYEALKSTELSAVFAVNNFSDLKSVIDFQFSIFGRGFVTFALFLIGICLGRWGGFKNLAEHKALFKKLIWWSLGSGIILLVCTFGLFSMMPEPGKFDTWLAAVAFTFYDLFNLAIASFYSCIFIFIAAKADGSRLSRIFAPYGRMALSNYILQAIIGTFIFYGWGLGYLGLLPNMTLLAVAVAIIAVQLYFSHWWMSCFNYGPLEWVWRSATKGRLFPLLKTKSILD